MIGQTVLTTLTTRQSAQQCTKHFLIFTSLICVWNRANKTFSWD